MVCDWEVAIPCEDNAGYTSPRGNETKIQMIPHRVRYLQRCGDQIDPESMTMRKGEIETINLPFGNAKSHKILF